MVLVLVLDRAQPGLKKCFKVAALLSEALGATLYFYGDNINYIFYKYGDVVGCGQQCVENNRIAAIITLGLSQMFYHFFPPCLHKVASRFKMGESTQWYSASSMFTTILKVDALFTVVAIMAQTTDFCGKTDLSISIRISGHFSGCRNCSNDHLQCLFV